MSQTSTILVADLAGYTAMTEAHGDDRAADEAASFCAGLRGLLGSFDAREVNAVGDALIVSVADAGQAVRLGARIAGEFGRRDRALGVRIGIHTGTAVRRGADWFGSAINIASRIADLAQSGDVFFSDATRQAAGDALSAMDVSPRGRRHLKHVPEPVTVFALAFADERTAPDLPVDPVCRMLVDPAGCAATRVYRGTQLHFCSDSCAAAFDRAPHRYAAVGPRSASRRVSDQARERAGRQLARAYSKGRLETHELEERTEIVWSARTRADLEGAVSDLPRRRRNTGAQWGPLWPLWVLGKRAQRRARRLAEQRRDRQLPR